MNYDFLFMGNKQLWCEIEGKLFIIRDTDSASEIMDTICKMANLHNENSLLRMMKEYTDNHLDQK